MHIGKMFREFRQSKNISLEKLSDGIVSAGFLAKFERGENDITATKLIKLLDRMNVSLLEFLLYFRDINSNSQPNFLDNYSVAIEKDNFHILDHLLKKERENYNSTKNFRHLHNQILITQTLLYMKREKFVEKDSLIISDYLLRVDDWSYYEISLLSNSLFFLPDTTLDYVANQLINKKSKFRNTFQDKSETASMITNIAVILIERNLLDNLNNLFKSFDNFTYESEYYLQITRMNFVKGLYNIKIGDIDSGIKLSEQAISIMEYMKNFNSAKNYKNYLDNFLIDN